MTESNRIRGAGGGKSGGAGGGISESPDTLSSLARARFVDLVGEGVIGGLVNGDSSIYLDGIPLRDTSGTPNYKPFNYLTTNGTQNQQPIPGFSGTSQENEVGLMLRQSQGKIIRPIPDSDADAVRVTVAVSGLSTTSQEGKISGSSVAYTVWARKLGSPTWVSVYLGNIAGKTGARYQRSTEINLKSTLNTTGPYEVAVERTTADSTSSLEVNPLFWDSYAVLNYEQYSYPNSALVAVEIDGRYFSSVPSRAYHVKGLLVRVPANYENGSADAPAGSNKYGTTGPGTSNGGWDGTFKTVWSNNPAWCFYDLVTNSRYGLGKRINASQVDKWELYKIGQYCDELVASGLSTNLFEFTGTAGVRADGSNISGIPVYTGPLEKRFSLNCVINTVDEAYRVLSQLTSVFRGMGFWASGQVALTQDRPADSLKFQWTNANVIDGMFTYSGSSRAERHTVVTVGWNDPGENFKQKFEYVEDRDGIARYGVRSTEFTQFGCTSRGQARRAGLWMLYSERLQKDVVSCKVSMDSARVRPGDVGLVADANRTGARWGGRVVSGTTAGVVLDAPLTLERGSYTLNITARDGSVVARGINVLTTATFTELLVSLPFDEAPATMSIWTLASTVVTPMQVRVVSMRQSEPNIWDVTALEHDPSKYDAIDWGTAFDPHNYSFLSYSSVPKVTGLVAVENSYKPTVTSAVVSDIYVSWDGKSDPTIRGYVVKLKSANEARNLPEQRDPFLTIAGVSVAVYTISVSAVNVIGVIGPATEVVLDVTGIDGTPPGDVENFRAEFDVGNGLTLFWDDVKDFIDYYEIREATEETLALLNGGYTGRASVGAVAYGELNSRFLWSATATSRCTVTVSGVADVVVLTSHPYPTYFEDNLDITHGLTSAVLRDPVILDEMTFSHSFLAGTLTNVQQNYSIPAEELEFSHAFLAGTLINAQQNYNNYAVEELDITHGLSSGVLTVVQVNYSNYAIEELDITHGLTSGTLT